jgi:hypothetical protein
VSRHRNWDFAEQLLKVMFPGSTGLTIGGLAPTPRDVWRPFDIEEREDDEVLADLMAECSHLTGPVVVVNDASYTLEYGPHFVDADRLQEFAESFAADFGSAFISGSMLFVAPATGDIVAVDDENLIAHIKGRPAFTMSPHYVEILNSGPGGPHS